MSSTDRKVFKYLNLGKISQHIIHIYTTFVRNVTDFTWHERHGHGTNTRYLTLHIYNTYTLIKTLYAEQNVKEYTLFDYFIIALLYKRNMDFQRTECERCWIGL